MSPNTASIQKTTKPTNEPGTSSRLSSVRLQMQTSPFISGKNSALPAGLSPRGLLNSAKDGAIGVAMCLTSGNGNFAIFRRYSREWDYFFLAIIIHGETMELPAATLVMSPNRWGFLSCVTWIWERKNVFSTVLIITHPIKNLTRGGALPDVVFLAVIV